VRAVFEELDAGSFAPRRHRGLARKAGVERCAAIESWPRECSARSSRPSVASLSDELEHDPERRGARARRASSIFFSPHKNNSEPERHCEGSACERRRTAL
jgi:hypothetical protein